MLFVVTLLVPMPITVLMCVVCVSCLESLMLDQSGEHLAMSARQLIDLEWDKLRFADFFKTTRRTFDTFAKIYQYLHLLHTKHGMNVVRNSCPQLIFFAIDNACLMCN